MKRGKLKSLENLIYGIFTLMHEENKNELRLF